MIRSATLHDLPRIIELGAIMHGESPRMGQLRFVPEKAAASLAGLIESPQALVLVGEDADGLVGGIAAAIDEHWFSTDKMAYDIALFIHPAKRGTLMAPRLLAAYKEWAKANGAVITQFGISTGVKVASTAQLLEHMGFSPSGFLYDAKD